MTLRYNADHFRSWRRVLLIVKVGGRDAVSVRGTGGGGVGSSGHRVESAGVGGSGGRGGSAVAGGAARSVDGPARQMMIVTDAGGRILSCGQTRPGSTADVTLAREAGLVDLLAQHPAVE